MHAGSNRVSGADAVWIVKDSSIGLTALPEILFSSTSLLASAAKTFAEL